LACNLIEFAVILLPGGNSIFQEECKLKLCRAGRIAMCLVFLLLSALLLATAAGGQYHLLKTYKYAAAPGGKEYFDYIVVDSPSRRVYLSHGTEVLVVNADTGALIGKISGFQRDHGIALVKSLGLGFITDGDAARVGVFNIKTLKKVGEIPAADDADCILYDPASRHVFTFNGDSQNSTVIDPATKKVVATVKLGGKPEFAVADGKGIIFNNLEDKSEVVVLDSQALKIKSRWPIAPAGEPAPIAIDAAHHRLFVSGRKPAKMVVMNADDGKVIQSFDISEGADANVFQPETGLLFVSTRAGKIHIFHEDTPDQLREVGTADTEVGAKTMGVDSKTGHLFADTADFRQPAGKRPEAVPGTFRLLVYAK